MDKESQKAAQALHEMHDIIINKLFLLNPYSGLPKFTKEEQANIVNDIGKFVTYIVDGALYRLGEFEWGPSGEKVPVSDRRKRTVDLQSYWLFDPLGNELVKMIGIKRVAKWLDSDERDLIVAIKRRSYVKGIFISTERRFNPSSKYAHRGGSQKQSEFESANKLENKLNYFNKNNEL